MTVHRTITLKVLVENRSPLDCLEVLFQEYWTPFDLNGRIRYLLLGDTEEFNFETTDSLSLVFSVIESKFQQGEFGLLLIYDESHWESIDLFIYPQTPTEVYNRFKLVFSFGIGKRLPDSDRYTDYSYYLSRIIPLLENNDFHFEEVTCNDYG